MTVGAGWYDTAREGDTLVFRAGGGWTIETVAALDRKLRELSIPRAKAVLIELAGLEALDTAGAWLVERTRLAFKDSGADVALSGAQPGYALLLERVSAAGALARLPPMPRRGVTARLAEIGEAMVGAGRQARDLLGFFGAVAVAFLRVSVRPGRMRFVSWISHLEQTGLNAMPIVGLLSFLIGVVLAYQGIDQLRRFGAEIFMVNLVGLSVLREMGVLLTSILVAGRSGSAFTAQIGTMQVNEELDALRAMGFDPIEVLVLPRLLALLVALPLLAFFANIMAILGGAIMASLLIDVTIPQFLRQLNDAVDLTQFWVGFGKAPVFALIIGIVGCFEGLRVRGSAESVGRLTTQAVVESIFLVIVFDAVFSILFSYLHI